MFDKLDWLFSGLGVFILTIIYNDVIKPKISMMSTEEKRSAIYFCLVTIIIIFGGIFGFIVGQAEYYKISFWEAALKVFRFE